jgi:hypothetical protein
MYLESIEGKLDGQRICIKYDCDGNFENCGKENTPLFKVAKKNFENNNGKHICRSCQLKSKNPMRNKDVQEKIKKTCLKKYGVTNPMNKTEHVEKRKQQFENQEFVDQVIEKRKETCKEKYGTEFAQQNEQVKQKQKATMQERYGVDHPYQSPEIMAKMKANNLEKYGVENVAQLPETQIKMAKTTLEKYGVERYNQLPEMKDYLRENCKEWLKESYANPWAKGIIRPEEWNQKQSETMTQKIINGEFNPEDKRFYVTGYYTSKKCKKLKSFFRSSLELMMNYLLDVNDDVVWYENEPFSIPYEKAPGIIRNYVPDFFAFRKENKPLLLEIKPAFRMRETEVLYKVKAAESFCEKNNLEFIYIDEKFLNKNSLSLKELELLEHVEIIKNK